MDLKGYFYIMSRQTGMVLEVDMAFECDQTYKPIVVRKLESEGEPKNQLWKYNIETGELESRMGGPEKRLRLDVSGGYAHNNARTINDTANGSPSQKWYFKPDGTIQSALGDKWVLEARETCGENKKILGDNTQVVLYDRETPLPSISQQWDAVPYVPTTGFYIRSSLHDLYLQIRENSADKALCVGDKAQLWTYNKKTRNIEMVMEDGSHNSIGVAKRKAEDRAKIIASLTHNDGLSQNWTFLKTGAIVSGLGGMQWVLDVRGSAGKGAEVILFTWHGKKNQQWYISEE